PSGSFCANGAWTVLAAIAFNLTRAASVLASARHARARPATIRDELIKIPARIANRARRLHLHLPTNWPWQDAWQGLVDAAYAPSRPRSPPRRGTTQVEKPGRPADSPCPEPRPPRSIPLSPSQRLSRNSLGGSRLRREARGVRAPVLKPRGARVALSATARPAVSCR